MRYISFIILGVLVGFSSCKKESFSWQNDVSFSTDTLTFDTVFTSLGSTTKYFKIYNHSSTNMVLNEVRLAGGNSSSYYMNVDGVSGTTIQNIKVLAKDSVYIFIQVKIDPNSASTPFLVEDDVQFSLDNQTKNVHLRAFGQNAYFHYGEMINANTTWQTDKPHVIIDKKTATSFVPGVLVNTGATLTIPKGARVYFAQRAGIFVRGKLQLGNAGNPSDSVHLRGLRLEKDYIHLAGQWLGIFFYRNSVGNTITNTVIDESLYGVYAGFQDSLDFQAAMNASSRPEITIKNSVIKNAYYYGIYALNAQITAENVVSFTSTQNLITLGLGGKYRFDNATFFNSQAKDQKTILLISNLAVDPYTQQQYSAPLDEAHFTNCIIYQSTQEESLTISTSTATAMNYLFENCLIRTKENATTSNYKDCVINKDPLFVKTDTDKEDLSLKTGSPCIDAGKNNGLTSDIRGLSRPSGAGYEIGAYEF